MYYGLLALLTRSLRQDARLLRNHIFRLIFVVFIYFAMLIASLTSGGFGAPGLSFFKYIAWMNLGLICCAGIGFFATAITEEKEEDTLGLLQMAGLNPLGILLGKSTSRLIQAALLLIVQFPFMLLSVTLGGVTTHQILAAYVALLAFMALLANVALLWSTVSYRGGSAAAMTTLMMVFYFLLPPGAKSLLAEIPKWGWSTADWQTNLLLRVLQWISESSIVDRIYAIMTTGFKEPVISTQVITNVTGGAVLFLLSWLLFVPCSKNVANAGASRGLVLRSTTRIQFLSPGRVWSWPLIWKDFQFIAGGYSFFVVKLVGYVLLFSLLFATYSFDYATGWWRFMESSWEEVNRIYVVCMLWAIAIEACILASRLFHDEIRLQTLSSLLMLPRSIPYLSYSKTIGCLMGLAPSVIALFLGILLLPIGDQGHILELVVQPQLWVGVLAVVIFLHMIALLSLFVRWGALPLAIVLMFPIGTCCPVWQLLFVLASPGANIIGTMTVWILMGLVCFVFQMMIAARLQELGSK